MRRHFLTRILSLFLTLAMGLSLPTPAGAGPELSRRTLRPLNAGLEEGNPITEELRARLLEGQAEPLNRPAPAAGLEEGSAEREKELKELEKLQPNVNAASVREMQHFIARYVVAQRDSVPAFSSLNQLQVDLMARAVVQERQNGGNFKHDRDFYRRMTSAPSGLPKVLEVDDEVWDRLSMRLLYDLNSRQIVAQLAGMLLGTVFLVGGAMLGPMWIVERLNERDRPQPVAPRARPVVPKEREAEVPLSPALKRPQYGPGQEDRLGNRMISPEELYGQPADVFLPPAIRQIAEGRLIGRRVVVSGHMGIRSGSTGSVAGVLKGVRYRFPFYRLDLEEVTVVEGEGPIIERDGTASVLILELGDGSLQVRASDEKEVPIRGGADRRSADLPPLPSAGLEEGVAKARRTLIEFVNQSEIRAALDTLKDTYPTGQPVPLAHLFNEVFNPEALRAAGFERGVAQMLGRGIWDPSIRIPAGTFAEPLRVHVQPGKIWSAAVEERLSQAVQDSVIALVDAEAAEIVVAETDIRADPRRQILLQVDGNSAGTVTPALLRHIEDLQQKQLIKAGGVILLYRKGDLDEDVYLFA